MHIERILKKKKRFSSSACLGVTYGNYLRIELNNWVKEAELSTVFHVFHFTITATGTGIYYIFGSFEMRK